MAQGPPVQVGDTSNQPAQCVVTLAPSARRPEGFFASERSPDDDGAGLGLKEDRLPTERKIALVKELSELIRGAEIAIATSYQGIGVAEQTQLRTSLRAAGVQFRVVKNRLLLRAADDAGLGQFKQLADGPTALVVGVEEPVSAARAINDYIKAHPDTPVTIRNAIVSGELVDADYVRELAAVPPRDELLARIAGGLIGQVRELAGLLQATTRDFVGLIEARSNQLEAEGGSEPQG